MKSHCYTINVFIFLSTFVQMLLRPAARLNKSLTVDHLFLVVVCCQLGVQFEVMCVVVI